eukprot:TRINITY_DN2109_c0_g1_i1.p1 TRINITY_DN2109_c0_g1~~TRINITY_DN2109_c0_g1_i1.p1  ORF type:complete len:754 (-),score=234.00 TRINITY_DN2109_c0_g1_i1:50-2278(-)
MQEEIKEQVTSTETVVENNNLPTTENQDQQNIENKEVKEEEKCKYDSVFGVDFGTTKLVASLSTRDNNFPTLVRNSMSNKVPCYVSFKENRRYIGEEGLTHAIRNPTGTVEEVKTILGRTKEEMEEKNKIKPYEIDTSKSHPTIQIDWNGETRTLYPEHLASMLITQVAQNVSKVHNPEGGKEDHSVKDCVVAIPQCWNENQLHSLRDAFGLSGVRIVRFVHDITAASLCYAFQKKLNENETKNVLFVDVGHNYTSAQICSFTDNKMKIVSTSSTHTGAHKLDELLAQHVISEFNKKHKIDLNTAKNSSKALFRIRKDVKGVKELLSTIPKATINLEVLYDGLDFKLDITRDTFEKLSASVLEEIENTILQVTQNNTFDFVEVIGGGQRIPCVKDRLARACGKELRYTLDSEHSITFGASILGAIHSGPTFNQGSNYIIENDPLENFVAKDWRLPEEIINQCTNLEIEMMTRDQINHDTDSVKNELESFIFETRQLIEQEDLQTYIKEEQKRELSQLLLEYDEWCCENHDQVLGTYKSKLEKLKEDSRSNAKEFFERLDFLEEEKKRLAAETSQNVPVKTNRSEKRLRPEEKIKLAEEKKDQGNKHFGDLDYSGAITRYTQAIALLNEIHDVPEETKQKSETLKLSIYLNLAMSNLKLKNFGKLIANCTNALKIDPKNVKALYRRSLGHSGEKLYDNALSDLKEASIIDPNNLDVKKELNRVNNIILKQKENEKKMYSKMFG